MELAVRKPASNSADGRSAAAAGVTAKHGGEGPEEGAPGARLEGSKGAGRGRARGMVLPFQPLALTFHHVNFYVDMPKARCQGQLGGDRAVSSSHVPGCGSSGRRLCAPPVHAGLSEVINAVCRREPRRLYAGCDA